MRGAEEGIPDTEERISDTEEGIPDTEERICGKKGKRMPGTGGRIPGTGQRPDAAYGAECRTVSLATGRLAYPFIADMARRLEGVLEDIRILVYPITNVFFGEQITVSGLLTGQDIAGQLAGRELGERLLLPWNVLRSGERVFLDDMTVEELENTLQVKVDIVKSSGHDFIDAIIDSIGVSGTECQ